MAHFSDKHSRKNMLMLSIVFMVILTFTIGVMPTFETIGYLAPILLPCIRIMQGISIGGELRGAWVFMGEHSIKDSLFTSTDILTAAVAGSIVSLIIHKNYETSIIAQWAWRIPFIIGGIFGIISIYLRKFLSQTPVLAIQKKK
ncbi:MAG: MFS transporter [Campylobacter sputorum]|nr:MFS transporter [Campylobacter sputorum]MDY6120448.1 MFS transporter [Campylobacter sputorum]